MINGKTCWVIYIDGVVLNDGGNVLDALSYACKAALASTRIPKVDIQMGEDGEEPEISIDGDTSSLIQLDASKAPVFVTVSQVRHSSRAELRCFGALKHLRCSSESLLFSAVGSHVE